MKVVEPVMSEPEVEAAKTVLRAVLDQRIIAEHDEDLVRHALESLEIAPVREGTKVVRDPSAKMLGPFARKSDTSRAAALKNYPRSGSQRARILELLILDPQGVSRERIAKALGLGDNSVRPRVRELIDGGWAQTTAATSKTAMGNECELIIPTNKAVAAFARGRTPDAVTA